MKPQIMKFDFKQQTDRPDTLELYIYSEVAPDGFNWWTGETIKSETSADFFRKKLTEYKDVRYINLYINSAGGSVKEGYGIYAQLKRHNAYKTAYVDGFANSIASVIVQACDKRTMYINSVMGIHNMMDWCFGNAEEHRQCADNLNSMMEGNRQLYLARASGKITIEKLTELLDKESILTAEECLEYGFCDEIADTTADAEDVMQKMQSMNMTMQSQIKYFSALKQTFKEAMTASPAHNVAEPLPEETEPGGPESKQTKQGDPRQKEQIPQEPEGKAADDHAPEPMQVKEFFMGIFG